MGAKLRSLVFLGSFGSLVLAAGCASSTPRDTGRVPDSAWDASPGSPRTSEPTPRVRTVRAARPTPSQGTPLTRDQVLQLASGRDPQDAIAEIDRHPLAFSLDGSNLAWFEDRLVPPEVADYLKKRAQVDWSTMRDPLADMPLPSQPQGGPPPSSDGWAEGPAQPAPESAPSVVVEEPQTTIVYDDSSPTIVVGASWYDGYYWRPWRPWYHRSSYGGPAVVYSGGYGGLYYSGRGNYGRGSYGGAAANYGSYPYTQGSFVYNQPRGFVQSRAITRPSVQTRGSFSGGTSGRSGGGGGGGHSTGHGGHR